MPSLRRLKQSLNTAWKTLSRGCSYQTTKLQRCPQYERHPNFCARKRFYQRFGDSNQKRSFSAVRQGENEDMCLQVDMERSEGSDFQRISRTVPLKREIARCIRTCLQAIVSMIKRILEVEQKCLNNQASGFSRPSFGRAKFQGQTSISK